MPATVTEDEATVVFMRRYSEAVNAGMDELEARTFAGSDIDVGKLRHLIDLGCPAELVAWILL